MAKLNVLSTKKLEPALIQKAKEKNIEIIEQEAIKINSIISKEKWNEVLQIIESKKEFAVFTSSNSVHALQKYLNDYINPFKIDWKIFSLSGKTKDTLEALRLGTIIETAENSKDLSGKIIERRVNDVVFFCGNKRRDELPKILTEKGIKVQEVTIYETVNTPVVAKKDIDAILFFSPSAVQSFFSINQLNKDVVCFTVGKTTADSVQNFTNNRIITCEQPSQEMMLASVETYFKTLIATNERTKK